MFTRRSLLLTLVASLILSACQVFRQPTPPNPQISDPTEVSSSGSAPESPGATATLAAEPAVTPTVPLTQLVVCLSEEPETLFWYQAVSPGARAVLAAVYDGPYDRLNFNNQPVILENIPEFESENVSLEPAVVAPGDRLYDAGGERAVLAEGVRYRPTGCLDPSCSVEYTGEGEVTLDRLVVRFRLKSGLRWSDGASLTADDSVFSYEVAVALQPPAWLAVLQGTQNYRALDDLTLEWRGLPGYLGGTYAEKFFSPLPRHAWGDISTETLIEAEASSRTPLGWGAYSVDRWEPGQGIVLSRNPNYFRAADGLPHFDRLVYRFLDEGQSGLEALGAGECDWLAPDAVPADQVGVAGGQLPSVQWVAGPPASWEQISLGIERSDGSAGMLAQAAVRQALAACIDRQGIAAAVPGRAQAAGGFLPAGHPHALPPEQVMTFDPASGGELLAGAGWLDLDADPATPRTSQGVPGFADGTPLALAYLISPDAERQAAAQRVQADLEACGVEVTVVTQPFQDYLAAGPDGPVFGRQFQMAQFAWPASGEDLCRLYLSGEIPGPYPDYPKGWGGGNAGGFRSPDFDRACLSVLTSPAGSQQQALALQEVQAVFAREVPAIPLYFRSEAAAAGPDLCLPGSQDAVGEPLWNIEAFYKDENCTP